MAKGIKLTGSSIQVTGSTEIKIPSTSDGFTLNQETSAGSYPFIRSDATSLKLFPGVDGGGFSFSRIDIGISTIELAASLGTFTIGPSLPSFGTGMRLYPGTYRSGILLNDESTADFVVRGHPSTLNFFEVTSYSNSTFNLTSSGVFKVQNTDNSNPYINVSASSDIIKLSGSTIQMTGSTYFDDEVYIKTGASETPLTLQVGSSTNSILRFQGNGSNTLKYSVGSGGGWYHSFLSNNIERFLIGDNYSAFRNSVQVTGSLNVSTNITASGTVSASIFYGDGSNLTGISAGGSGISSLSEDTAPQLGGNLDVNNFVITGSNIVARTSTEVFSASATQIDIGITDAAGTTDVYIGRSTSANPVIKIDASNDQTEISSGTNIIRVNNSGILNYPSGPGDWIQEYLQGSSTYWRVTDGTNDYLRVNKSADSGAGNCDSIIMSGSLVAITGSEIKLVDSDGDIYFRTEENNSGLGGIKYTQVGGGVSIVALMASNYIRTYGSTLLVDGATLDNSLNASSEYFRSVANDTTIYLGYNGPFRVTGSMAITGSTEIIIPHTSERNIGFTVKDDLGHNWIEISTSGSSAHYYNSISLAPNTNAGSSYQRVMIGDTPNSTNGPWSPLTIVNKIGDSYAMRLYGETYAQQSLNQFTWGKNTSQPILRHPLGFRLGLTGTDALFRITENNTSNGNELGNYMVISSSSDTIQFSGSTIQMTGSLKISDDLTVGSAGNGNAIINLARGSDGVTVGKIEQAGGLTYFDNIQGAGTKFRVQGTSLFEMMHIKNTGVNIGRVSTDISTITGSLDVSTNITASGTVSASAFYGDGSNLTGISSGISSLVADTTPQLGGTLDVNGQAISGSTVSLISDTVELTGSKFLFSSSQTYDHGLVYDVSSLTLRHNASSITVRSSNVVSIGGGNLQAGAGVWVSGGGSPWSLIDGKKWSFRANDTTGYYLYLGTSGSPKVVVTGSSLGIGTDTPSANLDIVGNISASAEVSASAFYGDGSSLTGISSGISSLVADTTPQLGGTLDVNGQGISGSSIQMTGSTQIELNEDSTQVFEIKGTESGADNRIVHDYFRVESANGESSRKIYIGRAIGDSSGGATRYISLASNEIIVKCQNATIDLDTNGITTTTYGNQLWKIDNAQNYTYKFQAKRNGEGAFSTPFEIDGDNNAATFIIRPTGSAGSSDITTAGSFLVKDTSDNEYFKVNLSASSNGSVESILSGDQIRLRYNGYDYIKVGENSIGSSTTGIQISSNTSDYLRLRSYGGSGNWLDLNGYTTTIAAFSTNGLINNYLYQDGAIFDVGAGSSATRYIEVKRGADTVKFSGSSIQMTGSVNLTGSGNEQFVIFNSDAGGSEKILRTKMYNGQPILQLYNGGNYGLIAYGHTNAPVIGAHDGGVLIIRGINNDNTAGGTDLAKFDFDKSIFQVTGSVDVSGSGYDTNFFRVQAGNGDWSGDLIKAYDVNGNPKIDLGGLTTIEDLNDTVTTLSIANTDQSIIILKESTNERAYIDRNHSSNYLRIYEKEGFLRLRGNTGIQMTGSVDITGNLTASGTVSASAFYGDGSNLTGISVTPGGSDNQIQFNNGGSFAGSSNLTWDDTNLNITGSLYITGSSGDIMSGSGNALLKVQTVGTASSYTDPQRLILAEFKGAGPGSLGTYQGHGIKFNCYNGVLYNIHGISINRDYSTFELDIGPRSISAPSYSRFQGYLQIMNLDNGVPSRLDFVRTPGYSVWYLALTNNASTADLGFYQGGLRGYLDNGTDVSNIDFTGQHRSESDEDLSNSIGLIVVSTGEYSQPLESGSYGTNININEAIPKISLADTRNNKKVFGVISDTDESMSRVEEINEEGEEPKTITRNIREYTVGSFVTVVDRDEEDNRIVVNSLGEGGIWVCNINGNLENGDYITSCEIPGYGMKQDDDLLHNYTVAKITCDCSFDLNSTIYECVEFEFEGQTYRKAFVGCTYHCG